MTNFRSLHVQLTILFIVFLHLSSIAQNQFDIRFQLDDFDCDTNIACYNVQLKSANNISYGLAGQNYRIYYDNTKADFISGSKVLDAAYGPFTLVQNVGPVNAASFSSNLGFESTLGFLNYSIDLSNLNTGGITLTQDWMTTSNLCFTVDPSVVVNPNECIELVWARDGLTNDLATAFCEVSEWEGINMTQAVEPGFHDDLDENDGEASCITPLCATVSNAQSEIRFVRTSVDCQTNQACYDVQLRSLNGNFNLAGQNYRIYYDNAKADFVSGTKLLNASYGSFNIANGGDVGPTDATAFSSSLGFESTLGFLNYSIDLDNLATGGVALSNDWFSTSNICFDIDENVLNDDNTCLELIWARDGLTNSLATAFVEVSEWTGVNSAASAEVVVHDDLDATEGSDACFNEDCNVVVIMVSSNVAVDENIGTASIEVCLTEAYNEDVVMLYTTNNNTALAGQDYTAVASAQATIPAGQLCQSLEIQIIDDASVEGSELLTIDVIPVSVGLFVPIEVQIEILDDDVLCEAEAPSVGPK